MQEFMAHEIAKLVLEQVDTFIDRREAVQTALNLGMPLNEIEEYLDWLKFVRGQGPEERTESGEE